MLFFGLVAADGKEKIIKGYAGGMMVHTGYLSGCDNPFGHNTKGVTLGIGGVMKVQVGKHFRTGFEGYVSTMGLGGELAEGSYNKVFWTGLLCDWFWKCGRFYPYIGATAGGGMETSYYMFSGDKTDWIPEEKAVFHKEPFFALDPYVGVEYSLKQSIRFTARVDNLLALNKSGLNRPVGPRLYLGILFTH